MYPRYIVPSVDYQLRISKLEPEIKEMLNLTETPDLVIFVLIYRYIIANHQVVYSTLISPQRTTTTTEKQQKKTKKEEVQALIEC